MFNVKDILPSKNHRFFQPISGILGELGEIETLPTLKWKGKGAEVSLILLSTYRQNVGKFFYDMVSRWLIPGKQVNVALHFSVDLPSESRECTLSELVLTFSTAEELEQARRNFAFLEREILMGVSSYYHAMKILEMKGLTLDDKTSLIQDKMGQMIRRFPGHFDYDLFHDMQQFLVSSKQSFKAAHKPEQISRVIWALYRFRKILKTQIASSPGKRHLTLRCKRSTVDTPFGGKEVLSIFLGFNFLKEHELFEERHFLSALSHCVPGVRTLADTYFSHEEEEEGIHTFYLEVEKENSRPFTQEEIAQIEKGLPDEIKSRIEQLVQPIFMPRNEEEVMRNILTLSHQLKYLRDIPQMVISFDEQTDAELSFTVVLVRVIHANSPTIQELFQHNSPFASLSIDRVKLVGRLRRKYPKEAAVLRVRLPSNDFLRKDYSVDLFKARLYLVKKMHAILGEVRDYNGGMIAKQSENFFHLKQELGSLAPKNPLLLQNFFHAIFPVHLSTTLDPKLLKELFCMLLEAIENPKESVTLRSKKASDHLFVMTKFQDFSWKQKIFSRIEGLQLASNSLLTVQLQVFDSFYLGFLYKAPEPDQQQAFLEAIPEALSCYI